LNTTARSGGKLHFREIFTKDPHQLSKGRVSKFSEKTTLRRSDSFSSKKNISDVLLGAEYAFVPEKGAAQQNHLR